MERKRRGEMKKTLKERRRDGKEWIGKQNEKQLKRLTAKRYMVDMN